MDTTAVGPPPPRSPDAVPQVVPRTTSADFWIGAWLVQPTLGRLSRGDEVVRLRPQLMDVLVCLASRHGRTVMRREVFGAVWSDHVVNESALARCVAELRQVLGDDARQPSVIETIPKRGYRIIAPISMVAEPGAEPGAEPAPPIDEDRPARPRLAMAAVVAIALLTALLLVGWALR